MKTFLLIPFAVAVMMVVPVIGGELPAAPGSEVAAVETSGNTDPSTWSTPELLTVAYDALSQANHNYLGHRESAMHRVSKAGELIGLELKGDKGLTGEQSKSDARLRLAQKLLILAKGRLTTEEQKPVVDKIERAIKQLSLALIDRGIEDGTLQVSSSAKAATPVP